MSTYSNQIASHVLGLIILSLVLNPLKADIDLPDSLPREKQARVLTNMADDLALCSAYYKIVSECMNNTESGAGVQFEQLGQQVIELAGGYLLLSNTATLQHAGKEVQSEKLIATTVETVGNWYNRYRDQMLEETRTCANISILNRNHLEVCNGYYENPDSLMQKWIEELQRE